MPSSHANSLAFLSVYIAMALLQSPGGLSGWSVSLAGLPVSAAAFLVVPSSRRTCLLTKLTGAPGGPAVVCSRFSCCLPVSGQAVCLSHPWLACRCLEQHLCVGSLPCSSLHRR